MVSSKAKIKLHPLFLVLGVVMIFLGRGVAFVSTLFALFFHEVAHGLMAKARGYRLNELVLLPYGAALYGEENIDGKSLVYIALAGPIINLILCFIVMALWWAFPSSKNCTSVFFWTNLSLFVFNLIPAFPLDGSRVVLGLFKNKLRALKALKIVGVVVSISLFALFIVSVFFEINFSLGIIAVFLYIGAQLGTKREEYNHVSDKLSKNFYVGVTEKKIVVSSETPLINLLRQMDEKTLLTVKIDGTDKELSEDELKKRFENFNLNAPIGKTFKLLK